MVDQLLGGLFGGQDNEDTTQQQTRAKDFVSRFETGAPHEGYSTEEAAHNYRHVAGRLSPQEYEDAATQTFGKMQPDQRKQFKRMMKERGGNRVPDVAGDDPRDLAQMAGRFHQQDSSGGGLASLFGFGGDNKGGGNLLQASQGGGGGGGSIMDNPLAKVAMGGIAAMAMKKMMNR
jgi:hypothetical protein